MKRHALVFAPLASLFVAAGCDTGDLPPTAPQQSPTAPQQSRKHSEVVAELVGPQNQKMEIRDNHEGTFLYVQSGPHGTAPMDIPADIAERGDPVEIYQALAPGREVPAKLHQAREGAKKYLESHPELLVATPPGGESDTISKSSDVAAIRQGLGGRDLNERGWTGQAGCPFSWFFNATSPGSGRRFCPQGEPNGVCYQNTPWAYHYSQNAWWGHGAVCTDSQDWALFEVTVGSNWDPFWVAQGEWRYVQLYGFSSCSFWTGCSKVKQLIKFDLRQNGNSSAQFGARLFF